MGSTKLGIIYLSYGRPELDEKALEPFIQLREDGICKIAAASSIFPEYLDVIEDKETYKRLKKLKEDNKIDYLYNNSIIYSETSLRTVLLKQLGDCEYILLVDADEIFDVSQIKAALEFSDRFPDIYYFDLAFRQYFRDEQHHIGIEYFKRLFRNNSNDSITQFYFDCDAEFTSGKDQIKARGKIPQGVLTVEHYTWVNSVAKNKIIYQTKRWGQDLCSFKWNEQLNQVELNENHYIKYNKPLPQIYKI